VWGRYFDVVFAGKMPVPNAWAVGFQRAANKAATAGERMADIVNPNYKV